MDQPDVDAAEHRHALAALARINWLSDSSGIFWPALRRLAREVGRPVRVLDLACGGGDVTIALARRARRAGLAGEFAGCDLSPVALEVARSRAEAAGMSVEFFQLNAKEREGKSWRDLAKKKQPMGAKIPPKAPLKKIK